MSNMSMNRQPLQPVSSVQAEERPTKASNSAQMLAINEFHISTLDADGGLVSRTHRAPGLPLFTSAFCAFSRGTLITTQGGPIAIEDLQPGDFLATDRNTFEPVIWIGSTVVTPSPDGHHLTRVTSDTFGVARPMTCETFGPAARILRTPDHLRGSETREMRLIPINMIADGENIIDVCPPRPVELFHLCVARHAIIEAGGLSVESFHPGANWLHDRSQTQKALFLTMFDHIAKPQDFGELARPQTPFQTS